MKTSKEILNETAKKFDYKDWDTVYSKGDNSAIIHILEIAVEDLAKANNNLMERFDKSFDLAEYRGKVIDKMILDSELKLKNMAELLNYSQFDLEEVGLPEVDTIEKLTDMIGIKFIDKQKGWQIVI